MINPVSADKYPIIKEIPEEPNERRTIEFKPSLSWPKRIDDSMLGKKIQEIIRSILPPIQVMKEDQIKFLKGKY